jgi:diguanylate cyclase (GGDEF)-like protein
MSYSIISTLALIINLIINRESFRTKKRLSGKSKTEPSFINCYRQFLFVSCCYFLVDIAWGILYEYHHVDHLFSVLYSDCVLYFVFLYMTILTWMRSLVAYLGKKRNRSKILLVSVWAIFFIGILCLIINRFHPFIFSFNEKHEFVVESGRYIAFILSIALYFVITIYMFYIAHKSNERDKAKYRAVGITCLLMNLFLFFQVFDPRYPSYSTGLIIGICMIHSFVESGERREKVIYDNIAKSLAEDYEAMYYINIETGKFLEFSKSQEYASMNVPVLGRNFYNETSVNIEKFVHPDDREFAKNLHRKETMLNNLKDRKSYSYKYRVIIDGQPRHFQFTVLRANDDKHFVLYEKDINDEITVENMRLENQKKQVTFTQIAEILAVNYDVIYYVDAKDSSYISYECRNIYGEVEVQKTGDNFFEDSRIDISNIVHKTDREEVLNFFSKDNLSQTLANQKSCSLNYRIVAFKKIHYVRMTAQKTSNGTHYIIGIENIDNEIKKEKQQLKALNTERELARRDELTGVKNKTAYNELEQSVQKNIENGMDYLPFGLVVCDTNDLKKINDSKGHVAGDDYIKNSAKLLCDIFVHSPVFRVGGDEFVVFLRGDDYSNKKELMKKLQDVVRQNIKMNAGPVLASGMAEYIPGKDCLVSEIFDRADKAMYKNKREIKKEK